MCNTRYIFCYHTYIFYLPASKLMYKYVNALGGWGWGGVGGLGWGVYNIQRV